MTPDLPIPEEALQAAEEAMRGHDCHEVVNANIPHLARVALQAALPHLRSLQVETREGEIPFLAQNIVNQLGDLWEVPVKVRQATNDRCDEFVTKLMDQYAKSYTGAAAEYGRALGRKEAVDALEAQAAALPRGSLGYASYRLGIEAIRDLAPQPQNATSEPRTDLPAHQRTPQDPEAATGGSAT